MLRYKAMARKARFVDVCEYLTTETCSECGALGGPKGCAGLEIRRGAVAVAVRFMIET
jgi:hypothetical protein